jgi:hypothetical protein
VLEDFLGTMVNCLLDAPLLYTKPEDAVQVILDAIEIPGAALAIAGKNQPPTDAASQQYTPKEAHDLLVKLFKTFPAMGRTVLIGPELEAFNAAVDTAELASRLQPTTSTCRELEQCLGLMFNLLFDSPPFKAKPLLERQLIIDCIEVTGRALAIAAGTSSLMPNSTRH